MIYILYWKTNNNKKTLSRPLEENSRTFQHCAKPEAAASPPGRPALIQLSEPDVIKAHSTQKRGTLAGYHPPERRCDSLSCKRSDNHFFF